MSENKIKTSEAISSITGGPRQSNFELLRILAVIYVIILHIKLGVLPNIPQEMTIDSPLKALFAAMSYDFTCVCVPLFALISGWFGIRLTVKGFCKFIFQCVFLTLLIILVLAAMGSTPPKSLCVKALLFFKTNWFIMSYIGLMILSPVLNTFVEHSTKRTFSIFLIMYGILACIWGARDAASYFVSGYSVCTLILYYMIAGWLRLYGNRRWYHYGLLVYLGLSLLASGLSYIGARYQMPYFNWAYLRPLIVLSSVSLFVWFATLKIGYSRIINTISASVFAIYFIHTSPLVVDDWFNPMLNKINPAGGLGVQIAVYAGAVFVVFFGSVIVDQLRIPAWKGVCKLFKFK